MTSRHTEDGSIALRVVTTDPQWLPAYQSHGASGADLFAAIGASLDIMPGKVSLIPTGLSLEVPEGYEVQIRPRSGLAFKSQVSVLNSPGTIDSDYRGEVKVLLMNHGEAVFTVLPGMRIAQMVLCPIVRANFVSVEALEETVRGSGGFGHTGLYTFGQTTSSP
jgi:dUTP pyrophosphatase